MSTSRRHRLSLHGFWPCLVVCLLPFTVPAGAQDAGLVDLGNGVLHDPGRGLEWTGQDNGKDVTWQQASDHCASLSLEGGRWTLPTVEQLKALYQPDAAEQSCGRFLPCRVSSHLTLTSGLFWSLEPAPATPGWSLSISFYDGSEHSFARNESFNFRALCVRPRGEPAGHAFRVHQRQP